MQREERGLCKSFPRLGALRASAAKLRMFFTRKGTKSKAATKSIKRRHHEDHEGHEVYIRSFVAFASFVVRPSYEYGD
jgi:hypothetical protein